ncbi:MULTISPECIES: NAD(P)H-dependent oxidoreductase [Chryseobacterium]|jgi:nitroreductase|uniref:NAD(P)H-dependent oxidoreductase n=1 Tax=Chryseobacterium rhizosphaerae TaxID=395937 RepID=A0AAE3Y8E8_9FLAO|nr:MULTISPECIES: NAD(P)H-dependent oxidoreductase [Chryseobacterium]MBL3546832.1 NAD(P)H-dependent oxidoreductase [Chryseobacterium sp. KMC2]MDR6526929.1 nitroreductase [Chryseobacterium rhizosphaerae]MDR6544481.1 nitroreductase [Chryseobacterium rhizosphaerae]REC78223.1 NAD(P)H-dependent oxidoreductase [Chryseobacterium rhizosphaerae]SMC76776.1 Nitroreductase [Chryseobacterium sp. YR221]
MNYLEALSRRYSVKKFNHQVIPQETLYNILESGKLSASSLGLQPYKILVVESEAMKQKLIPAFYNPSQISTCSHLIVIISKKTIDESYIRGYFNHISEVRETSLEKLEPFKNSINQHIVQKTQDEIFNWAEKQSYIVLANLMYAAAIENIDSCPMEGFRQDIIEEILSINPETEKVTVTLALGYRSEEDYFQHMKKVRKPNEKLFKFM